MAKHKHADELKSSGRQPAKSLLLVCFLVLKHGKNLHGLPIH